MKQKSLPKFLALTICLELIVSPLAMAQQTATQVGLGVLQTGLGIMNSVIGNNQQPSNSYVAADMQAFQAQQTPLPDKYFTHNNLTKIPGLAEYVAKRNADAAASGGKQINLASLNCQTLPSTLSKPNNEVCRNKSVSALSSPDQQRAQADEAFGYYNQYKQIENLYTNYTTKSNVGGQVYGVGCMEDAMEILNGFFAYRLEQLDTMVTEFEAAEARFEAGSEMDLKAMRESTAILGGEESPFATEFKNTNVLNYGERFGDAACNSIMAKNDIDGLGKGRGLKGIEETLKKSFSGPAEGSKYSPESYLKNNAAVVDDIKKMADKAATQATLNFSQIANDQTGYSTFLNSLGSSVSTDTGVNVALNSSFFSDVQTKFTQTRNSLRNSMGVLNSELGPKGSNAMALISNIDNDSNFEAQVKSLEKSIKNECLSNSGIDTALSRVYEPNLSKQASKHSSNELTKKLKSILSDPNLTPESKISQLSALNSAGGSRFEVRLDADFETKVMNADGTVGTKKAIAASTTTPASFFTSLIQNCETQFQVNKLGNQLTGKQAVQQLRTLKEEYKKAAKQNAQDIKSEITKKMIECNGNAEVASSSNVGSCSPAVLDMSKPSFCTKAAFSCSTNMKSCTEKAQKAVADIKDDRLKRTNNYNNNVEVMRKQLVGMFDTTLAKYMKEAESLRGMFGAGFTSPAGIERDVKNGNQFDPKFLSNREDALEVKNPKAYLDMVKGNMKNLREQVAKQQEGIIGKDGNLQKHIELTKKNYEKIPGESSKLAEACLMAYNKYNETMAQQKAAYDKSASELGEKSTEFCGRYTDVMSRSPLAGCDDDLSDLSNSMIKAAKQNSNPAIASEAERMRREMVQVCGSVGRESSTTTKVPETTAAFACRTATKEVSKELDNFAKQTQIELKEGAKLTTSCSEKSKDTKDCLCEAVTSGKCKDPETCKRYEDNIISIFDSVTGKSNRINGTTATKDFDKITDTPGSFCNASNNSSGNTKTNLGGLGSFLNGLQQGPTGMSQ